MSELTVTVPLELLKLVLLRARRDSIDAKELHDVIGQDKAERCETALKDIRTLSGFVQLADPNHIPVEVPEDV